MSYKILQGDNRETLKTIADNSIDAIVTDPPYGIDFLGKAWDANTGALETYQECLRVLKPGGHILAFSAARTYHHLAITLEQAGFEIRDQIMWIYSSGFPKSQDIGKSIERSENKRKGRLGPLYTPAQGNPKITACEMCGAGNGVLKASKCQEDECPFKKIAKPADNAWAGWGTALKPAHEPIALARKPMKSSIAKNCQKWGTGALNIDATRIPYADEKDMEGAGLNWNKTGYETGGPRFIGSGDEHTEVEKPKEKKNNINEQGRFPSNVLGEIPDYQKYFYCPKVSRRERHLGFDLNKVPTIEHNDPETIHLHPLWTPAIGKNVYRLKQAIEEHNAKIPEPLFGDAKGCYDPETGERYAVAFDAAAKGNNHPTVKPIELMKYLIRLITPPGGTVLDPFNGSGSTGCAAVELGYDYIGCELDPAYVDISTRRIDAWLKHCDPLKATGLFE